MGRLCLNLRWRGDGRSRRVGGWVLLPGCSIERFARFHHEAKQSVSIVSLCFGRIPASSGCNGQYAKQVSIADVSIPAANDNPDVRGQITMKRTVSLQPFHDGMQRFGRSGETTSFLEEVLQLGDLIRITSLHLFEL